MLNQSVKISSRRNFLVSLGRMVLLVLTAGFTGFLLRQRRCWYLEDVNYTQLPCQICRQLKKCEKPTANVYRSDQSTKQTDS